MTQQHPAPQPYPVAGASQGHQQMPQAYSAKPPRSTATVVALLFGLVAAVLAGLTWWFHWWTAVPAVVFGLLGIILGHLGLSRVKRRGFRGKGAGVFGLLLSYLAVIAAIALLVLGISTQKTQSEQVVNELLSPLGITVEELPEPLQDRIRDLDLDQLGQIDLEGLMKGDLNPEQYFHELFGDLNLDDMLSGIDLDQILGDIDLNEFFNNLNFDEMLGDLGNLFGELGDLGDFGDFFGDFNLDDLGSLFGSN